MVDLPSQPLAKAAAALHELDAILLAAGHGQDAEGA
jgi:hypothetical protein